MATLATSILSHKDRTPLGDFVDAARMHRLWLRLGRLDLQMRNKRSMLGPLWITMHTALYMALIGFVFSLIFDGGFKTRYLPYFCISYIYWRVISHNILDSCNAYRNASRYILQQSLPLPIWIYRIVWKNTLYAACILPIYFVVMAAYGMVPDASYVTLIPAVLILLVNIIWLGTLLAIVCLRYRDLFPAIQTIVHVAYLVTPILWQPESLGEYAWVAQINPLYHQIETLRACFLGYWPSPLSWMVVVGLAVGGSIVALTVYSRTRHRVPFWL